MAHQIATSDSRTRTIHGTGVDHIPDTPPPITQAQGVASAEIWSSASNAINAKTTAILSACETRDVQMLCGLATQPLGLLKDSLRRVAWPIILGCRVEDTQQSGHDTGDRHVDEDQVRLDVNRSFIYYPDNESESQIKQRKKDLEELIISTLRKHRYLSYFQGFHDIVQVFLLVLGSNAPPAVARLSLLQIRDFMLPTMAGAITHLKLLPEILHAADPEVAKHLSHTQPFFALAATLTLYAHEIQEYSDIARLFDFLLSQEAVIPLYLFAVVVCSRKAELFEVAPDEPEMLHSILSKLPDPLDLEHLIAQTIKLFKRCPPDELSSWTWFRVSKFSVLKTTRDRRALIQQRLSDGERYFRNQAAQIRMNRAISHGWSAMIRFRRPTGAVGLAILVVFISWWLNRKGVGSGLFARWSKYW